jgi:hypothetical protein
MMSNQPHVHVTGGNHYLHHTLVLQTDILCRSSNTACRETFSSSITRQSSELADISFAIFMGYWI